MVLVPCRRSGLWIAAPQGSCWSGASCNEPTRKRTGEHGEHALMAITLKRQLTDDEKQCILKTHGRKCFATGHPIPEGDIVQFDHIRAFASGGLTELSNIAPMCELHNKAKGALPLEDF